MTDVHFHDVGRGEVSSVAARWRALKPAQNGLELGVGMLRKPDQSEAMYVDVDGFFASMEQFMHPELRNKPVGVVPMISGSSCVIAASREAKAMGVSNVMRIQEARDICPGLIEQPQHPDLYRRGHNEMMSEISVICPIEAVMSIDELYCILGDNQLDDPQAVGTAIKAELFGVFKGWVNASMGYGPNPLLAKMACKAGKPDGNNLWTARNLYQHLMAQDLSDIPGIGPAMLARLNKAGITSVERLLDLPPGQMAALWGSVQGRRMYYALHGYDVHVSPTQKRMFGHSRMLPPDCRTLDTVRPIARLLQVKAARRMRRELYRASCVGLGLSFYTRGGSATWGRQRHLPQSADYDAILGGLGAMWREAANDIPRGTVLAAVHVNLSELTPMSQRQLDLFEEDEGARSKKEALADAMDYLNRRYCSTVIYPGLRNDVPADNIGMKIAYGRIPHIEDGF